MDNYWKNNSKEFKEFIDLLIAGYRSNEKKVSISLKLLSELTTQEKDAGKQLAKLMFRTSKIWKTETKAFTKINYDSDVLNFIINLTDDNRFNIKYLQRGESKAII